METFVLRLWAPGDGTREVTREIRGVVEHVASGTRGRFAGEEELAAFILGMLALTHPVPETGATGN